MDKKLKYSPLRFLSSPGNGGMVVTFFLYLNFLVPLKNNVPIVDFYSYLYYLQNGSWYIKAFIIFAITGVLYFSFRHLYSLFENLIVFKNHPFPQQDKFDQGRELMALPLTSAMAVNVMFMLGSLFIPGLWNITEFLFPFAIASFLAIGIWGLKMFMGYFSYHIQHGDKSSTNNLSRLIPCFAFSMVAVGLAAAGAMSHLKLTASIGSLTSMFFLSITIFLGFIELTAGFISIVKDGLDEEGSASIWILIPILTISGIAMIRHFHYFDHHLGVHIATPYYFLLITFLFSIQIFIGILGYIVMRSNGYFNDYVRGKKRSFGSYALICPGVACIFCLWNVFYSVRADKNGDFDTLFSYSYFTYCLTFFNSGQDHCYHCPFGQETFKKLKSTSQGP